MIEETIAYQKIGKKEKHLTNLTYSCLHRNIVRRCLEYPCSMLTVVIPDVVILTVRLFTVYVLMYSPDGINVCGSLGRSAVDLGVESCKIMFLGDMTRLIHLFSDTFAVGCIV